MTIEIGKDLADLLGLIGFFACTGVLGYCFFKFVSTMGK